MAIEVSNITETSADISTSFETFAPAISNSKNYILRFGNRTEVSQRVEGTRTIDKVTVSLSGTVTGLSPGTTYVAIVLRENFVGNLLLTTVIEGTASFTTLTAVTLQCNCDWSGHTRNSPGHDGSPCDLNSNEHGARPIVLQPPSPTVTLQNNAPDPPIAGETYGATATFSADRSTYFLVTWWESVQGFRDRHRVYDNSSSIGGLAPGTRYQINVQACNDGGCSGITTMSGEIPDFEEETGPQPRRCHCNTIARADRPKGHEDHPYYQSENATFHGNSGARCEETTHPGAPPGTPIPVEPKCNCGIGGGKDDPGHNDQGMGCEASNHSHPLTKPDQIDITDFRVRCSDDRQTISMSVSWSRTERAAVYKVYWYNGSNLLNPGGSRTTNLSAERGDFPQGVHNSVTVEAVNTEGSTSASRSTTQGCALVLPGDCHCGNAYTYKKHDNSVAGHSAGTTCTDSNHPADDGGMGDDKEETGPPPPKRCNCDYHNLEDFEAEHTNEGNGCEGDDHPDPPPPVVFNQVPQSAEPVHFSI